MADAQVHVVVDANILAAGFCPVTHKDETVKNRSQILIKSICETNWPYIRLYAPSICIAEALGVIDKYKYCTWYGELKANPSKQLSDSDYQSVLSKLNDSVKNRKIVQIEHEPDHILFSNLISPVNAFYQLGYNSPMGAMDCVIGAFAILMKTRLSCKRVILVTADSRLASVIEKCKKLSLDEMKYLGLEETSKICGINWSTEIYPECVNLKDVSNEELVKQFIGWPLPTCQFNYRIVEDLLPEEGVDLCQIWRDISKEYAFLNNNPDNLPYTLALDDLRTRLAVKSKILMPNEDIYRRIVNWRKSKSWPDGGQNQTDEQNDTPLFRA